MLHSSFGTVIRLLAGHPSNYGSILGSSTWLISPPKHPEHF